MQSMNYARDARGEQRDDLFINQTCACSPGCTWKRALSTKVPTFGYQKMGLRAPKTKNGVQKPRKTPPKMVYKTFVSAVYHFHASIKLILKFAHHLLSFLRCSPPSRNQKLPKLRGPQFCRRNTKSFCDDLVRYNSQLWETVTMKFWLVYILVHPSAHLATSSPLPNFSIGVSKLIK